MFNKLKSFADKIDPSLAEKAMNTIQNHLQQGNSSQSQPTEHSDSQSKSSNTIINDPVVINGKKRALLIGINYFKQKGELKGCINDVKNVEKFLRNGYQFHDIRILTDDQTQNQPTKQNILDGFQWLVQGAQPGDSLFLHYSGTFYLIQGHGTHQKDKKGDEADGNDECLCPVDYARSGLITDDDLHDILVKPLAKGIKLTAIFDCCHSGSIMDLPFTYQPDGNNNIMVRNNTKEALQAGLSAFQALSSGNRDLAVKEVFKAMSLLSNKEQPKPPRTVQEKISKAEIIMFSGCMDNQTSADAHIEGQSTGAMSWSILKVLENKKSITLTELLQQTRQHLQGHFKQVPQMSCGYEMNVARHQFTL